MWDLARMRMELYQRAYRATTARRLFKYASQGFTASQGCIVSLLRAVGDDPDLIYSGIRYVD